MHPMGVHPGAPTPECMQTRLTTILGECTRPPSYPRRVLCTCIQLAPRASALGFPGATANTSIFPKMLNYEKIKLIPILIHYDLFQGLS